MHRALRMALRDKGVEWPSNALRHSFASYHLALHQDGGKLALQLGHGGGMSVLIRHYREIVSPEAVRAWFEVRPASLNGEKKVVERPKGRTRRKLSPVFTLYVMRNLPLYCC
jgi:2,4-dienoyl-CoA reductase-like NADH-dependent reductase (Old Yellow Enzyme family)